MKRLALAAAAVMVAGIWLPWARLSVSLFGADSPYLDVKGSQIGSDVGSLPWGYFLAGLGVVAFLSISSGRRGLSITAGLLGVLFCIANLSTLSGSHVQVSVGGQSIDEVGAHVTPAWGSFVVLVAAAIVAFASIRGPQEIEPS